MHSIDESQGEAILRAILDIANTAAADGGPGAWGTVADVAAARLELLQLGQNVVASDPHVLKLLDELMALLGVPAWGGVPGARGCHRDVAHSVA